MKYPFDYCIIAINEVKPFVKLQLESLVKPNPRFNIAGGCSYKDFASFHIVDKGTKDGVVDYCKKTIPSIVIHELDYYSPQNKNCSVRDSFWQWDLAYSIQHAIENCGTSDWILIMHPDIVYWDSKKYFDGLWGMTGNDVGQVWEGGVILTNREAYYQSHLGFWPLFESTIYTNKETNAKYLIHNRDERKQEDSLRIQGIEAGELFLIELLLLGWRTPIVPYKISRNKEHTAQSTGHDIGPAQAELWNNKINLLKERLAYYGGV